MISLEEENAILRSIVQDTLWMARRYADGRATYAVGMVNDAIDKADEIGVATRPDLVLHRKPYKYAWDRGGFEDWRWAEKTQNPRQL